MPQGQGEPYSFDYHESADGTVHFRCSTDQERWPWLALCPHHPLVIQTQNFWASYGAIVFAKGIEEGQWSALTWTDWQIGDQECGHAVRGVYRSLGEGGKASYTLTLLDDADREIVTMSGRGVVFRNRNFEEWRQGAKDAARKTKPAHAFAYAKPADLGLGDGEFAFIAPLIEGEPRIEALITPENGMPPDNRVISGSGDHVNTTHFGEVTRQALCLITRDPGVQVTGGEMTLKRYVELGTPFSLSFERSKSEPRTLTFALEQQGKACAEIVLRW